MASKNKPEVCVSVGGYDCTGTGDWTADELRRVARIFLEAAVAIDTRTHGTIDDPDNLVSIGIDCGGPFDDETGLPAIPRIKGPLSVTE